MMVELLPNFKIRILILPHWKPLQI